MKRWVYESMTKGNRLPRSTVELKELGGVVNNDVTTLGLLTGPSPRSRLIFESTLSRCCGLESYCSAHRAQCATRTVNCARRYIHYITARSTLRLGVASAASSHDTLLPT